MQAANPTPYPDLNEVLRQLVASIQAILADNFVAACLQGSFAVGGFDIHSDVDFIVAIDQELPDDQVQALQAMHGRLFDLEIPWAQHLEGSYFPTETLRRYDLVGSDLWYLDHGANRLIRASHCNTVVVRWTVREFGVPLAGPSPATLVEPIPVTVLRREILAAMNDWGREILAEPERYSNRFYQGYLVLNYSRMLHDLINGQTGSKRAGAAWAKKTLDPAWTGLIDRAWGGRPDPARSVRTPADPSEYERTLAFVQYVMDESMKYAAALEM